ncbi:MAG TPA: secretion protein [Anaeromyxobacter sp.]
MRFACTAVAVLALAGCAGDEVLHGLDERQANEVLVALDQGGVAASKAREDGAEERWRVEVSRGEAARAQRILAERELPRARAPGFGEVFGKGSMVPTPTEEHALLLHALAGELARSLEAVDGVVAARVHVGLRAPDPLRPGERGAPRASVLLKCRAAACTAVRALEPGLRAMVAGAVDGLDPGAVALVVTEAAEVRPAAPAPARRAGLLAGLAAAAALAAAGLAAPAVRARLRREPPP